MFRITDGQRDYGMFHDREVADIFAQEFRQEGFEWRFENSMMTTRTTE
jgi:hypothetical protein